MVTTGPDSATAVPQLGLCLGLLKGVAEVMAGVPQAETGLVGRLFRSRFNGKKHQWEKALWEMSSSSTPCV